MEGKNKMEEMQNVPIEIVKEFSFAEDMSNAVKKREAVDILDDQIESVSDGGKMDFVVGVVRKFQSDTNGNIAFLTVVTKDDDTGDNWINIVIARCSPDDPWYEYLKQTVCPEFFLASMCGILLGGTEYQIDMRMSADKIRNALNTVDVLNMMDEDIVRRIVD